MQKTAGERLKAIREAQRLSRPKLAQKAGCSERTIQRREEGKPIRLDILQRVAAALGVPAAELLDEGEELEADEVTREDLAAELLEVFRRHGAEENEELRAFADYAHGALERALARSK